MFWAKVRYYKGKISVHEFLWGILAQI